jgi:hypothetical protein
VSWISINQRLTRVFGLDGRRVRAFTLRVEAGQPPLITVTRLLIEDGDVREIDQVFDLVEHPHAGTADPYALAMARVIARIDELAEQASRKLKADHFRAMGRLAHRRKP